MDVTHEMQDDTGERQKLYAETRTDLLKRQLSNSENFDRSVLSLSSAILAASIAFIKPSAAGSGTGHTLFLTASWIALTVAIASTMLSFLVSQIAIDRQLDFAMQYYLHRKDDALHSRNRPAKWTVYLNWCAAVAFAFGIVFTVCFAVLNFPKR